MSDNPFDVFAADFKAAIPTTDDKNTGGQNGQPINIMAEPAPAPVPVMNAPAAPVMNQQPPPQQQLGMSMNGMSMNGMSMNGMGMNQPQGMYGGGYGMNAPYGAPPPAPTMGGMPGAPGTVPGAMVPSAQQSNPYAMNMGGMYGQQPPPQMPYGAAPPAAPGVPPSPSPYGAPPPPAGGSAPPPTSDDPFGAPSVAVAPPVPTPVPAPAAGDPFGAPPAPSNAAPPVPPPSSDDPFGAPSVPTNVPPPVPPAPVPPPTSGDPFGAPAPVQNSAMPPNDPYGAPAPSADPWAQPPAPGNDAIVPVANDASNDDPFGVFSSGPSNDAVSVDTPAPKNYTQAQINAAADSPWDFNSTSPDRSGQQNPAPAAEGGGSLLGGDDGLVPVAEENKPDELPPGGEWYDARIFTPTLGVMFFKPQELTDSLFLQTERSLVDALNDRPVVAFIVEGSSARAAGVELGHVLLKVNGIDVKNPKEASRLIKEGPRPLPLLFYVPDTNVVVAEGEHMVKYDTRETMAPNSAKDWKPKYVVIGGIIAQPWMMNMYRSKSEYDIAVIETQARRPVSVKVKQFSLQGARIQNDWQGPQMVKYKNKLHPWKYIVILPISRNPIKISSPNLTQLKPVHEGIRRVLMAQQRYAPSPNRGGDSYGGPPQQQQPQPQPQQYPQQGGGGYPGGPPQQQQPQYGGGGPYGQEQYNTAGGTASARRRTPQY